MNKRSAICDQGLVGRVSGERSLHIPGDRHPTLGGNGMPPYIGRVSILGALAISCDCRPGFHTRRTLLDARQSAAMECRPT